MKSLSKICISLFLLTYGITIQAQNNNPAKTQASQQQKASSDKKKSS